MDYVARFDAAACGNDIDFLLTVKAHVTTLCPCSKAIAKYGAHNQRGLVTVALRFKRPVWIEDVIAIIEASASSELYALLKRQDEKAVTERAYENLFLWKISSATWLALECPSAGDIVQG